MRVVAALRRASAILIATAATSSAQIVGANADSIPNASWVGIYFRHLDGAARAAGLTPLRELQLPAGEREIRLWPQTELSALSRLYQFTSRRGRVLGALVYSWEASPPKESLQERPGETTHDLLVYSLRGQCERFAVVAERGVCRARFRREPAWDRVLRAAESHGLWRLPDPSTLPSDSLIGIDGWSMVVEVRDGPRYRTYRYHNPWSHPKWPSAAQANEIARTLQGIDSLLVPSDVRRVYRGVTTGRYRSAFRSCEDGATWDFYSDLRSLLKYAPPGVGAGFRALADSGVADSALYEVEVFGEPTPEWLARRWESAYPRVLQVLELRSVRPAAPSGCSPRRGR